MNLTRQPWLESTRIDSIFILMPAVLPLLFVWLFPNYFESHTSVNSLWWVILVLNIDVAHVYSTLFRFYWDRKTFQQYKRHLILIPVIGFGLGVLLYAIDGMLFWRVLAYVAVFHFVRQQFGFMRLYARHESYSKVNRTIDAVVIYAATLYPLMYWHMHYIDQFNWFVKGDFVAIPDTFTPLLTGLYVLIILIYLIKELYFSFKTKTFNIPKNALVAGTLVSWYVGIILYRGDLIFTMLNVVAHGIPYMALVYIYGRKRNPETVKSPWRSVLVFVATILVLAYLEEGLWDTFIWNDHQEVFPWATEHLLTNSWIIWIIPLLALPQITHYVLDGFIWKVSKEKKVIDSV